MAKRPQTDQPEAAAPATGTAAPATPAPRILVQGEGRTVLQEDGRPWPAEGIEDPDTLFTRRRLRDGDLVVKTDQPEGEAE